MRNASVKHTIIGSDNGLLPIRRQAIIWTNVAILSIGPQGTYFSEILFKIQKFSFKEMHLKMSSAKWRPFCFGLNCVNESSWDDPTLIIWLPIVFNGWERGELPRVLWNRQLGPSRVQFNEVGQKTVQVPKSDNGWYHKDTEMGKRSFEFRIWARVSEIWPSNVEFTS